MKSELYKQITDTTYRKKMDELANSKICLESMKISDTILLTLKSPS
ncbi:putative oxidoreductase [Gluconobacter morbifer G707]|uniref:Putative oxidoreductase n=1 Tax=Gluconobacter morbifer G707 TaxID=1088869 RepID=G6XM84_9PROT|nr:putative oxidoreductase [Gluconobacter morbifer G707]